MLSFSGHQGKKWCIVCLILVVFCILAVEELGALPDGRLHIYFLNVGEGDATLLVSPSGKEILIDGGPDLSALEQLGKVLPFFGRSLDLLILTHPDQDHLASLPEVFRRYDVARILLPRTESNAGRYRLLLSEISSQEVPVLLADSSRDVDLGDGVTLDVLWPLPSREDEGNPDTNASSTVIKVLLGTKSVVLLTGDIEQDTERALLAEGVDLAASILKVPHHGSKTSSSTGFLLAVHPDTAILSVGEVNPYGHPHPSIVGRYHTLEIPLRSTATEGMIRLDF